MVDTLSLENLLSKFTKFAIVITDIIKELNLQTIRRELIDLLEEYTHDCVHCKSLKCNCSKQASQRNLYSLFHHDPRSVSGTSVKFKIPPPANALPQPKWTTDNPAYNKTSAAKIRSLMRTSTVDNKVAKSEIIPIEEIYIWPPFPKSTWSVDSKVENERVNSDDESASSVHSFFRYFRRKKNSMSSTRS